MMCGRVLVGTVGAVAAVDLVETGSKIGNMSTTAVLGLVACVCAYAMYRMYSDRMAEHEKHSEKLIEMLNKNIETMTSVSEVIRKCKRHEG